MITTHILDRTWTLRANPVLEIQFYDILVYITHLKYIKNAWYSEISLAIQSLINQSLTRYHQTFINNSHTIMMEFNLLIMIPVIEK